MPVFLNALLCGIAGAIAAHVAYVQANLFLLDDAVRRGRHPLFDPLAFDALGLLWGLVAGGVCAAWLSASAPWKAALLGLGLTLAGIGAVGAGTTAQRYAALPRTPSIDGKELWLDFELRLPPGATNLPEHGELRTTGQGNDITGVMVIASRKEIRDGRIVLPGAAELRRAARDRRLEIFDGNTPWPSFQLTLPASPTQADTAWTGWYPAESDDAGTRQKAHGYQIRYRVQMQSD
jgi:hypothetical protein